LIQNCARRAVKALGRQQRDRARAHLKAGLTAARDDLFAGQQLALLNLERALAEHAELELVSSEVMQAAENVDVRGRRDVGQEAHAGDAGESEAVDEAGEERTIVLGRRIGRGARGGKSAVEPHGQLNAVRDGDAGPLPQRQLGDGVDAEVEVAGGRRANVQAGAGLVQPNTGAALVGSTALVDDVAVHVPNALRAQPELQTGSVSRRFAGERGTLLTVSEYLPVFFMSSAAPIAFWDSTRAFFSRMTFQFCVQQ
jgi:hypothetical protein